MKRTVLFLFLILLTVGSVFGQQQHSFNPKQFHYLWPTEASSFLSSTFGETRAGHFHAALDIKTWGRRGYKVFATRDGIVDRIAIGPRGYGKVIYLKHDDGSYSVYAHLLAFNDHLQQLADSIRFSKDYAFEIDRKIADRNIRVKQGEVIGYSGASGIGPPHLHFELRTPSEKPYNPLLTNLRVRDTIPPQIKGISVEPLSAASSIEGENAIFTKRAWHNNNHYELGTVRASGKIGLGVNVFDQSNKVHNAYAVYELQLTVDGQDLFKSQIDSFSYEETHQMFIDRVYPILENSNQGYQRLFIADGNSLPFYRRDGRNGKLDLPAGTHDVRIRATDYFGNSSTAHLTLNITDQPITHELPPQTEDKQNKIAGNVEDLHWFPNWITFTDSQTQHITVATTDTNSFFKHSNGYALNLENLDNLFMEIPSAGPMQLRRIIPTKRGYLPSANGQGFAVFPEHTFYDSLSVGMSVQKSRSDSIRVHILPEVFPTNKQFSFYISRDSSLTDIQKLAWYKRDEKDREWDLIPTSFTKEYLIGHPETLGTFAILRDTVAPELSRPRLQQRPDGQWLVMVDVNDNLSGLDYPRTKMWVNNKRGIAEFEPEDDRIVYYHPDFEPSSTSPLAVTVEAFDYMGNRQSRTFYLDLSSRNDTAKK